MGLIKKFRNSISSASMQEKLFDELLIIAFMVSIITIIGNIFTGFPMVANIKWVFILFLVYFTNKAKHRFPSVKFYFCLFIAAIILPLGWYQSGANNNNVIAYIFLMVVAFTFLFTGKQRLFLIVLLAIYFTLFVIVEFKYPNFLPHYSSQIQFTDRLIQIPLAMFASYLMLRQFSNAYRLNSTRLKELNTELEIIAYTDALTGLYNRGYIFKKFKEIINDQIKFTTILIDIDNFKDINDNYGHLEGDDLLENFGHLLKKHFNSLGYVARYGGDEFIVILFLDMNVVENYISTLVSDFAKLSSQFDIKPTLSGGYGQFAHTSLESYLHEIDASLYGAKKMGKNKFIGI